MEGAEIKRYKRAYAALYAQDVEKFRAEVVSLSVISCPYSNRYPLVHQAASCCAEGLLILIDAKYDVHEIWNGVYPIHSAIHSGNLASVKVLIHYDSSLLMKKTTMYTFWCQGSTPLRGAVISGFYEICAFLLQSNCSHDLTCTVNGTPNVPLFGTGHARIYQGYQNERIIRLLLLYGALNGDTSNYPKWALEVKRRVDCLVMWAAVASRRRVKRIIGKDMVREIGLAVKNLL